jgi:hypothetical protein
VFLTPPWPEIYSTDPERRHSLEKARDGTAVVADQPQGEADQDWREDNEPRALRDFPDGRGAVSRQMFADILTLITRLRAPPAPA